MCALCAGPAFTADRAIDGRTRRTRVAAAHRTAAVISVFLPSKTHRTRRARSSDCSIRPRWSACHSGGGYPHRYPVAPVLPVLPNGPEGPVPPVAPVPPVVLCRTYEMQRFVAFRLPGGARVACRSRVARCPGVGNVTDEQRLAMTHPVAPCALAPVPPLGPVAPVGPVGPVALPNGNEHHGEPVVYPGSPRQPRRPRLPRCPHGPGGPGGPQIGGEGQNASSETDSLQRTDMSQAKRRLVLVTRLLCQETNCRASAPTARVDADNATPAVPASNVDA